MDKKLIKDMIENEHLVCPYCGSDNVEEDEAIVVDSVRCFHHNYWCIECSSHMTLKFGIKCIEGQVFDEDDEGDITTAYIGVEYPQIPRHSVKANVDIKE